MSNRRIALGVVANVYDKFIVTLSQLILVPVLASYWGVSVYGTWLLIATIPTFLSASDIGFATAAGTRMTMLVAQGRREETIEVYQTSLVTIICCSLTALLCFGSFEILMPNSWLPQATNFEADEVRIALLVLTCYGIISLQGSLFIGALRCAGQYALAPVWSANTVFFETISVVLIVFSGGGPVQVAASYLACRLLALVALFALVRMKVSWLKAGFRHFRFLRLRELAGPAVAVLPIPLGQAGVLQGTAIALGMAAGEAAVPAFTAVRTLSRLGLQVTQLGIHAIMPELSASVGRGDHQTQGRLVAATIVVSAVIAVLGMLGLFFFGDLIVYYWTRNTIHPPQEVFIIMSLSVLLGGMWYPMANILLAMNRQSSFSFYFLVAAFLSVIVSYWLAVWIGATGAAMSMALLDCIMALIVFNALRGSLGPEGKEHLKFARIIAMVASFIRRGKLAIHVMLQWASKWL